MSCYTNLLTLKDDFISNHDINPKLIKKNDTFQNISNTNKIKKLGLREHCTLYKMQLFVNLFTQLEYLKTGMNRKEIVPIIQYLLSKTKIKT